MIPVTKPFLPPLGEYTALLEGIWGRNWLTNDGPLATELESQLKKFLGVSGLCLVSNGTMGIQLTLKALGLQGEVITTPYSYVATTSSLVWEGCTPVFVDVDPRSLNIDPVQVEAAISPRTKAVLATHVYGNPCDVMQLEEIGRKHGIKIIYDGAHSFGVTLAGRSIFCYGDASIASFHATKLYHTIEGGAVITANQDLQRMIGLMRNFGHDGPGRFSALGINGKNSEFHAAMGLVNLKYIREIIERRRILSERYDRVLDRFPATRPVWHVAASQNYSYYAIQLEDEELTPKVVSCLEHYQIFPRRYFWPSLDELPYLSGADVPNARLAASRALCLPLYHELTEEQVDQVGHLMMKALNIS